MAADDLYSLPPGLPMPVDDGAADGLEGRRLPAITLAASSGPTVDLAEAARDLLVLYLYPRTGDPGRALPEDWDAIPGARGCTVESCAFRDHAGDLAALGARVHGLGAQPLTEQRAFAERERLPYPLLNDSELRLADDPGLPTFEVAGERLYKRLTLIARAGAIVKVFYPVPDPDTHAGAVVKWLAGEARS